MSVEQKWIGCLLSSLLLFCIVPLKAFGTSQTDITAGTNGLNEFAFDLYKQVGQTDHNLVISPYILSSLLTTLLNGASGNTYTQLAKLLHVNDIQHTTGLSLFNTIDSELMSKPACNGWFRCKVVQIKNQLGYSDGIPQLFIATALWADEEFSYKPSFIERMQQNKYIQFYRVNFKAAPELARKTINDWVGNMTHSYIQQLIPPDAIGSQTTLILVSTIFFKGSWQQPFKSDDTGQQSFLLSNGQSIQVPMMEQQNVFSYTENDSLQMLQLPYSNSSIEMIILLPKLNHTLKEIQQNLSQQALSELLQSSSQNKIQYHFSVPQPIHVHLPRFKLESSFDSLNEIFKRMGLTEAFTDSANFSNMTNSVLSITRIIQKAIIQTDETGTVATAAAAVVGNTTGPPPPLPIEFNANHPFIFMLYDTKLRYILFIGQVSNPLDP